MLFQVVEGLTALSAFGALFMVLLGVMWVIYGAYEANRRKSWRKLTKVDDWDFPITTFLRIISLLGFVVGILCIIVGAGSLILDLPPSELYGLKIAAERNLFTGIFLIVLGFITFIKPLNDIPIASGIGLLAATGVCLLIVFLIPDVAVQFIALYVNPKIVLIVTFIIIFAIVAITVKFYTAGLMFISKIISWPPFAFILAAFCIIQGGSLLLTGASLL